MRLIGLPRVTRAKLAELKWIGQKVGSVANVKLERKVPRVRKWYVPREVNKFFLNEGSGGGREKGVWESVVRTLKAKGGLERPAR